MNHFNSKSGLIVVTCNIIGPSGNRYARLALDTGATSTIICKEIVVAIGYDPESLADYVKITTGSGVETTVRLNVARIEALGQSREVFPIIAHTLPPTAAVDGLLGLDFFRDHILTLDFKNGQIGLE